MLKIKQKTHIIMKNIISFFAFLCCSFVILSASAQEIPLTEAPENAVLYFIEPANLETVSSPVVIKFGLINMGVAPAGVNLANTGHHHLLIDLEELPAFDAPLPANANVRHFGLGQTETTLSLPSGEHTLQLVLGDWLHIPHNNPLVSEKITIIVE